MLDSIWTFLKDPANQAVFTWIGGGIAVFAGALWAIIKFFAKKRRRGRETERQRRGGKCRHRRRQRGQPHQIRTRGRSKR